MKSRPEKKLACSTQQEISSLLGLIFDSEDGDDKFHLNVS
jgi:hypothetical protein